MADALYQLRKVQFGEESNKGTLVAATVQMVGDATYTEEQDFYRSPYPAGVRSNVGGLGVITRKGVMVEIASDLTAEEILWPLNCGVKDVTGVDSSGDVTHTYAPELTTGIPTLATATIEYIESDGSTNHVAREFGYGLCSEFSIEWAFNQVAKLTHKWFARASQSSTPTGSLTAYSGRKALVSPLLSVYLDTSWSGIGGTQLSGTVRSCKLDVSTGLAPDYKLDGRADLDFTKYKVGPLTAKLSMVLELDASGATQIASYRSNSGLFIRLKQLGDTVVAAQRMVQVDGSYRFVSPPQIAPDGDQTLVTLDLESYYDVTGTKALEFAVLNGLTSM